MNEIIKIENQEFQLDKINETFFATQEQIATIFDCTIANVSLHIINIYKTKELNEKDTFKFFLNVSNQQVKHYNLDMIIAIGYRVNSTKATHFRKQATKVLKEYFLTGEVKKQELSQEDQMLLLAQNVIKQIEENKKLRLENNQKEEVIKEYIAIDNNKNFTEIAKSLHLKPNKFIEQLRLRSYINSKNIPYQDYINNGFFIVKKTTREINGQVKHFESCLVAPKGFQHFFKRVEKGEFDNIKVKK